MIFGVLRQFDLRSSVVDQRSILVRFAADKTVEFFETGMDRPAVVRPRSRYLPGRGFVVLTKSRGAESILSQDFRHSRYRLRSYAVIAGKCSRGFHD